MFYLINEYIHTKDSNYNMSLHSGMSVIRCRKQEDSPKRNCCQMCSGIWNLILFFRIHEIP